MHLCHLQFADNFVLILEDIDEISTMLQQLNQESKNSIWKLCQNENNKIGKRKDPYRWRDNRKYQQIQLPRRYSYPRLCSENNMILNLKREFYEICVLPRSTYGMETIALTQAYTNTLRVMQGAMLGAWETISEMRRDAGEQGSRTLKE